MTDELRRLGGFHGRIGRIDLTSSEVSYEEPSPTWYRRYGGGGALAAWYLLREIPVGAAALGPDNVIVFASSIVGGADAPALSKHTVLAKSPLTGGAGESQSVSTFGPAFKRAGLDAVVIRGQADEPSVIVVRDGVVTIEAARELWGLDIADAHDRLVTRHGERAHTALIGVAGENLVRFASIVNDVRSMCCRTGLGAVLGSKRLKGLVAIEGDDVPVADPATARLAIDDYWANRRSCVVNQAQEDAGVASWLADTPGGTWPIPARNFGRALFPEVGRIAGSRLEAEYKVEEDPPPNIEYARRYAVRRGPFATDERYGGLEVNTMASLGPMLWLGDIEAVLKAAELTYRYGLDPESLGGTLAWAMECGEQEGVPASGGDGRTLEWGDGQGVVELVEAIAHRRGSGDLLAEGSRRAAERIGKGTELAMTCKGKEIPPHEPRNKPGLALAYGAGPIGPDYCAVEHDWDYSPGGFDYILDKSRAYGMLERTPEDDLGPRKVRQVLYLHRWWSGALESLLFDLFGVAPARYMPPLRMEQLIRGITGWDLSLLEVMLIGERRLALLQEFNRREGLTRADDFLPRRFYDEPLGEGGYAGAVLDRNAYGKALDLLYAMSGWDAEGRPTDAKLHDLELGWVVELPERQPCGLQRGTAAQDLI